MRERLIGAALRLYRDEGLNAVSFRRLADAVGSSHTLPYRYFTDKQALLAAMRCQCTRRFEHFVIGRADAQTGVEARIRALAAAYIEFARRYTADYLLIFTTEQPPATVYPELLAARRDVFDYAAELIQAGVDTGLLAGDPRTTAHLLWVTLHGLTTLYAANQLVHGRSLDELVAPVIEAALVAVTAGKFTNDGADHEQSHRHFEPVGRRSGGV